MSRTTCCRQIDAPLVLAMDEVDEHVRRRLPLRLLRHAARLAQQPRRPSSVWRQLDLALVTSTEPYQLIANLNQSPFNVGQVIELADFTPDAGAPT